MTLATMQKSADGKAVMLSLIHICSLGDWEANAKKLLGGLKGLSDKIRGLGLQFGIWVEPEMVNVKSKLYVAHPDLSLIHILIKKNEPLRMVGISHPGKSDVHGMPQNFLLKSFLLLPQSLVWIKAIVVIFQTVILTGLQCVLLHRISAPGAVRYAFPPVNHGFASAAFQGESVLSCI